MRRRGPAGPSLPGAVLTGLLLAGGLVLGGCAVPAAVTGTYLAAEGTSLNSTKKTLADHLVSAATGEDCSTLSFTNTGTYCPEKVVVDRSRVYCYRTLADVDCHHIPDPYKNGNTALASPAPDRRVLPRNRGWIDDWQAPPQAQPSN